MPVNKNSKIKQENIYK